MAEREEKIVMSCTENMGEILVQFPEGLSAVILTPEHALAMAQCLVDLAQRSQQGSIGNFTKILDISDKPLETQAERDEWIEKLLPAIHSMMPPGDGKDGRTPFTLAVFHKDKDGKTYCQYGGSAPRHIAITAMGELLGQLHVSDDGKILQVKQPSAEPTPSEN